jgi:hypothetical protein
MGEREEWPVRVQLSRKKGWRMPPNTVSVARPGRWGNQFRVGVGGDAAECVRLFAQSMMPYRHGGPVTDYYISAANLEAVEEELAGKNLACWCPLDQPCHADVLLKLANPPTSKQTRETQGSE